MRILSNEYWEQVTRILKLTDGRTGGEGHRKREENGSEIARFSGEDRKELRGWKVHLPLKITGKPRIFDTKQKKLQYAFGRLEKVALAQIMPYCNRVSGEVKLNSLKTLVDMLEMACGDQDKAATVKGELLKLKQRDHEFSQYYAEFQRFVADVKWNAEVQMDELQNGLSNELKNSLQLADMPNNIVHFIKMCSKQNLHIRARVAEKKLGQWEGGYKKSDNTNNTTSAPEASPAGTVAGYHGPAPMDLSALKGSVTGVRR
jgi:hypothetical protein